ncbi:MAG: hypothetical protein R3F14_29230 [Polyangiaceae bacterium]
MNATDLPDGFLHVVIFGPGHGEAILVRTPDGRTGVVDGCGKKPDASERGSPVFPLLEALRVERLLFACLTHPHRDHFGGFAAMIQRHTTEHLWWSGSQERKFFEHYLDYLKKYRSKKEIDASQPPLSEDLEALVHAISWVADRQDVTPTPRAQHLSDWKRVLWHPIRDRAPLQVESVLPTSAAVRRAEVDAYKVLGAKDPDARRLDPNRISAALLVTWGKTRVLLGGDALTGEAESFAGWDGLQFPLEKVQLVKVPHHASEGAYSTERWREMNPDLAIVTCVKRATANQPPRPEMLQRLLETGSRVVITSRPQWWSTTSHRLRAEPGPWAVEPAAALGTGNPALTGRARPSPAANNQKNGVVVRFEENGQVLVVQLHGAARELRLD